MARIVPISVTKYYEEDFKFIESFPNRSHLICELVRAYRLTYENDEKGATQVAPLEEKKTSQIFENNILFDVDKLQDY